MSDKLHRMVLVIETKDTYTMDQLHEDLNIVIYGDGEPDDVLEAGGRLCENITDVIDPTDINLAR